MGIPSFYRWLNERFPLCIVDAVDQPTPSGGDDIPANPNGVEFDNLYLDMNGVIHPCFHPNNGPSPETYDQVFQAIFISIDKLVSIVRPRKILFLAIDGVAPRAKMNQQRSRRFRAAKDAPKEPQEPGCGTKKDLFDSNIITPGTEFMALLASALRDYIHLRMNEGSQLWKRLKVILSDASVPGEGEHKIMSYIRLQRDLPGYDPNTRHCLYGLDADLIMLALASHEIHFSILREDKKPDRKAVAKLAASKRLCKLRVQKFLWYFAHQKFKFLHVWIVREYLAHTLKIPGQKRSDVDLERLIDDFVLMCLFVGNDFLPHMPTLDIIEGAIDLLMEIYKEEFSRMGGYLTNSSEVNLERVKHFLVAVGQNEDTIFKERGKMEKKIPHPRKFSQQKGQSNRSSQQTSQQSIPSQKSIPQNLGNVNYEQPGWKNTYYDVKLDAKTDEDRERIRSDVVLKYTEGICWVMSYYYKNVCSWQWFYPYHYAPFASDFHDTEMSTIQFTLGEPFKPFDQLMAVLPAASAHALPPAYQKLMTDPLSPLAPFYPEDFELDMNDKKMEWQAICKLPFIEESLLLSEIAKIDHELTEEESKRNTLGASRLFIHGSHPLAEEIVSLYHSLTDHTQSTKHEINSKFSDGMNGYIFLPEKLELLEKIESQNTDVEEVKDNKVMSLTYEFPPFHPHISRIPEGAQLPSKTVRRKDIPPKPLLGHKRSTAVGRLHSVSSIPYSISGARLQKAARRIVSTWLLRVKQGLEIPEDGGTQSCENTNQPKKKARLTGTDTTNNDLVSVSTQTRVGNARDAWKHNAQIVAGVTRPVFLQGPLRVNMVKKANQIAGDTRFGCKSGKKRKRKRKEKLAATDVGMTSSTVTQTPITVASISSLGDTAFVAPNVSSIKTSADENSINGEAPVNMVKKANQIAGDTRFGCKSGKKSKRKRKEKLAATDVGRTSSTLMQTPITVASISSLGDTAFVAPNVSSIKTSADENSINGEAPVKNNDEGKVVRQNQVPIDVSGATTNENGKTGSDCKSDKKPLRRTKKKAKLAGNDVGVRSSTVAQAGTATASLLYSGDTKFVTPYVSSIQSSADKNSIDGEVPVKDNDEGNAVRQSIVPTDTGGNITDEKSEIGSDCKLEKRLRKRKKKAKLAANDLGMTSSTVTQAPTTTASILNFGDTALVTPNVPSIQTSADKNSIDGEAPVKENDEDKVVRQTKVPIDVGRTATNEIKGKTGSDFESEKKPRRRKKKAKLAGNDVGMTSSTAAQSRTTTASISNLGDSTFVPANVSSIQTSADKNSIDGEAPVNDNDEGKVVRQTNVPINVSGTATSEIKGETGSDSKSEKKPRRKKKAKLAGNDAGMMSSAVTKTPIPTASNLEETTFLPPNMSSIQTSADPNINRGEAPVKDNDEGKVVRQTNVPVDVGGTASNVIKGENGSDCKSEKKPRRTKRKAKPSGNDGVMKGSTSTQAPTTPALILDSGDVTFATLNASSIQTNPVKDNDEGKAALENNVKEAVDVSVNQSSIEGEARHRIMPTVEVTEAEETRPVVLQDQVEDTGKAVSDCKLGNKRRRIKKKAIVPSVDDDKNDLRTTSSTQIQTKAPIIADYEGGSKLVLTQDPVKDNGKGKVVSENTVREATCVAGTETTGNTEDAESGCKRKRKRLSKKERLASVVVVDSVGA